MLRTRNEIFILGAERGPASGTTMDPGLKLALCLLIDLVGISSFAVPGAGEATDIGWAPVSAILINYLFGSPVFTSLALVEELLPGFDIIPTATIAWILENFSKGPPPSEDVGVDDEFVAKSRRRPQGILKDAIDVTTSDSSSS